MKKIFAGILLLMMTLVVNAQSTMNWPKGKKAVIVLTYDDALASQLNIAIPQLDSANLKGTFFLKEPVSEKDIDRWRAASRRGHELGNHTVYHPCLSSSIPADPRYQSENYSVEDILREIGVMNKFLYAIDGKASHTYAYPCGETSVGGESYVDDLKSSGLIKYARAIGSSPVITDFKDLDPLEVPCLIYNSASSAEDLIDFVKEVQQSGGMGVLTFHGVGGDYLEVSSGEHRKLLQYLKMHNAEIWVATFEEAMSYVTGNLK